MEPHLSGLLPRQPRSVEYSVAHADPVATTATVLKVVDGDTVDIVDDVRGRLRIRLLGIDTPETKKPGYTVGCWGPEATEFVKSTLLEATCRLRRRSESGHVRPLRPNLGLPGQGPTDGTTRSKRPARVRPIPTSITAIPRLEPARSPLPSRRQRPPVGACGDRRASAKRPRTTMIRRGSPRPQSPPAMRSAPTAQCRAGTAQGTNDTTMRS